MKTLFIFRRDLRIYDNTTLNKIYDKKNQIIPIFIFNKKQIDKDINKYYSSNAAQFLFESLEELNFLNFYYTDNEIDIIEKLYNKYKFSTIAYNKDYTPYAIKRDHEINKWCNKNKIDIISYEDYTLLNIGEIVKDNNEPYVKFTPFYNKYILKKPKPLLNNIDLKKIKFIKDDTLSLKNIDFLKPDYNNNILVNGGRKNALTILKKVKDGYFNNYDEERNFPYLDKTTKLSAYIKFGCLSIREIYYSLPLKHGIIRELIWHDFYANITFYFPYIFGSSFLKKYNNITWENNNSLFEKWKNGMTGFPLIDAAMRQLNKCGWMHNRNRMVVASFLVKNLLIDWKKGEHYFATSLVDYDPSSNNGGWQWCASTGTDAQPYFRIFSPTLQMKRYDKDCIYIKKWVPELKSVPNKIILNWEKKQDDNINYPKPIIDIKSSSQRFINLFKKNL